MTDVWNVNQSYGTHSPSTPKEIVYKDGGGRRQYSLDNDIKAMIKVNSKLIIRMRVQCITFIFRYIRDWNTLTLHFCESIPVSKEVSISNSYALFGTPSRALWNTFTNADSDRSNLYLRRANLRNVSRILQQQGIIKSTLENGFIQSKGVRPPLFPNRSHFQLSCVSTVR